MRDSAASLDGRPSMLTIPRFAAITLFLWLGAFVSSAWSQDLRFHSGTFGTPGASERSAQESRVAGLGRGGARHVLVQFARPLSARERKLWKRAGLRIKSALGGGHYFARVTPRAFGGHDAARLAGLLDVREIELGWKLHPALLGDETPPWTVVALDGDGVPVVVVYVLLHEGAALERGDLLVRRLEGSVLDVLETVNGLVALVPRTRIAELASADEVSWVEPALPRLVEANNSNRALVQADTLQAAPYGLTGSGVGVLLYDAGTARSTHFDFGGRLTPRDLTPMSAHATHVAGTLGGSGVASGGTLKGMAPGVTMESYGYENDSTGVPYYTNPGDLEEDYADAIAFTDVDLANNSLAPNIDGMGLPCTIQGDYGVICSLIDGVVTGSLGAPLTVFFANGNERLGTRCDVEGFPGYYSVSPPATAKNHITVGAVNSNDDSMTIFSGWGPTDDGRLKPTVCAPGCQTSGDFGVSSVSATSNTTYVVNCGTSMATPTACGIAALLLQDYRVQFPGPDPINSTVKAFLAHTAVDGGNAGPDYQFGYGSIRGQSAVDSMRLGNFREATLAEQGANVRWSVTVAPSAPELRLTLAWDDPPAAPNVFDTLVNDLDLVVRDPLGTQHHVWTLDPLDPAAPAVQTGPDRVNNIEQVLVVAPIAGTWTVEVRGHEVAEGPQTFSLVSSHALVDGPFLRISFPAPLPLVLAPGVPTTVTARIEAVGDTLVPGTPTLHVSYDGGPAIELPMGALGGNLFAADLPPPVCTATPEFFVSAEGLASGLASSPDEAPASVHQALVADLTTVFLDDFELDHGWTVVNDPLLLGGAWVRGVPAGDGAGSDPLNDFDGTGGCFVTGNTGSDVDGGPTRLISPTFDLSSGNEFEVSYARWFANDNFDADALLVEISGDGGGSWTPVETVQNGGGWVFTSFLVGDFIAPTNQVQVRFSAADAALDAVQEAAIDAFRIVRRSCTPLPDCNENGIVDADDIASGRSLDLDASDVPDECERSKKLHRTTPPGTAPGVQVP